MPEEKRYINRELSWLSFNERVLQEAEDAKVPLVERLRFLGIFSNNLDEFFRIRMGTLKRMVKVGKRAKEMYGDDPKAIINEIQKVVITFQKRFEATYQKIIKDLEREHIFIVNEQQLTDEQGVFVKDYFHEKVRPALVPVILDYTSLPYLKGKAIYLAVQLTNRKAQGKPQHALIEVPTVVCPRFVVLPQHGDKKYIILLDDVIRYCLDDIFSVFGYKNIKAYTVKLTRDAELDLDNDVSQSLVEKIAKSLKQRREGNPVRFVYDAIIPDTFLNIFIKRLKLSKSENLIPGGRYHNFKDFMNFPNVGSDKLEYKLSAPLQHKHLSHYQSNLDIIRNKDFLLHYPYQSFDYVIDILREAAIDPRVTTIKMTAYRLASESKVVNALINAARNGTLVTVVIELQARFDEEANLSWANQLQEEGVKVIFGVPGLKVHSKLILINRKEQGKTVRYANISTGNYNEETGRLYCDEGLFTADKRITTEVNNIFSFLENNYKSFNYKHLIVSPHFMRKKITRLINQEIKNAKAGKEAYMILKVNNLVDYDIIDKLYEASDAGVEVKMIVRGMCALIPGKEGLSENIEVVSIVDKYLEHSRIFVFCNNGQPLYFISSADLMTRNLDHRVEVTCPVYDQALQQELQMLLDIQLKDNVKARIIDEEQKNSYKKPQRGEQRVRSQTAYYNYLKMLRG